MKTVFLSKIILILLFIPFSLVSYRVKKGDTLWGIAKKKHISVAKIKALNNLSGNMLVPGSTLRVRAISYGSKNYYIVKKGDSIWGICRKFGLTNHEFFAINKLKPGLLEVGVRVNVKRKAVAHRRAVTHRKTVWHWYRVRKRDTFWSIAKKSRVSVTSLKQLNRKKRNNLYPGSRIKIPGYARKRTSYRVVRSHRRGYFGSIPSVGKGFFKWPMLGRVIARFGVKRKGINNGITIRGYRNKSVCASGKGVVVFSGLKRGYGNMIIIRHQNSIYTVYAGLKSRVVSLNRKVNRGEKIGKCGWFNEKKTYGLRFQIYNKTKPVNPLKYLG